MATATTPPRPMQFNREDSHRRCVHPLQSLRGYIRFYVSLEGLAVSLIYLSLWFWIGLLIDYGFFFVFKIDWVQILPFTFRAAMLLGLTVGLLSVVALKVVLRLLREFRDPALALVLERRFPQLLGDRLITAVELADSKIADKCGFSNAMVEHTIHDAAQRVEKLPMNEVFNWNRLYRYAGLVAGVSLGIFLLVGLASCAIANEGPGDFLHRFKDVASIWYERNILLQESYWPRRSYLEIVDFPKEGQRGDELKVGRGNASPTIKVRALKWVISEPDRKVAPEGWRALKWSDLSEQSDIREELSAALERKPTFVSTGDSGSAKALTASLKSGNAADLVKDIKGENWRGSVDEINMQVDKEEIRQNTASFAARDILEALEQVAAMPKMSRRMRMLEVPQAVLIKYSGLTVSNEQTLEKQGDMEFSGALAELKESIKFYARGDDYDTPYKKITVVPPPEISELVRDERQPAYLYYRVPRDSKPEELVGKKQLFTNEPVSLMGDVSRIDVPTGTDIVLIAKADKDLLPGENGVRMEQSNKSIPLVNVPIKRLDGNKFVVEFKNVNSVIDFRFRITDTDEVENTRRVIIKPTDDLAPEVEVQIEVVRKTNQGYLVTPSAKVPFSGKVRDDRGLSRIEYTYALSSADEKANQFVQAVVVSRLLASPAASVDLIQQMLAFQQLGAFNKSTEDEKTDSVMLRTFDKKLSELTAEAMTMRAINDACLKRPTSNFHSAVNRRMLKEFPIEQEDERFDISRLDLKAKGENASQTRYRIRLRVAATDTNIEAKQPGYNKSKEEFTLIVVSENELLAAIAQDEETLRTKFQDAVERVQKSRIGLEKIISELAALKADEFRPITRRSEEVTEAVVKSSDIAREVLTEYKKILKEMQANEVKANIVSKIENKIVDPLKAIMEPDHNAKYTYFAVEEASRLLSKVLDEQSKDATKAANIEARKAAAEAELANMDQLLVKLNEILDAMTEVITINKLIADLVEIEKAEEEEIKRLEAYRKWLIDQIFGDK